MKDGRAKFVNLAGKLGVTETAIRKRVRKMEEEGIIVGYSVEIDPKKLGYGKRVIIGVDTTPQNYISVIQTLKNNKDVLRLFESSGDHMILMDCWFKTSDQLHEFLENLKKLEGITDICPAIINEIIK